MNVTDHSEGFTQKKERTQTSKGNVWAFPGRGNSLDFTRELGTRMAYRWENQRLLGLDFNAALGVIFRQFQFMAILFLCLLVLSIEYGFVLIIPVWGLFIQGKGASVLVLRAVVFKIALKCYSSPALRLAFSWEGRPQEPGGLERWAAGVWRGCGVFCIATRRGTLSLRTLTVLLEDFLVCSPGMIRL